MLKFFTSYHKIIFKKGFTLIELLVVISITSLLTSVVLPQLNESRYKARIAASQQFEGTILHTLGVDLVGSWSFDEGGGTIAKDGSGYGNNITVPNSWVYDSDLKKNVLYLNGTTISFGNSSRFDSSEFTISFWVKPIQFVGCMQGIDALVAREQYQVSGFRSSLEPGYKFSFWDNESGGNFNMLRLSPSLQQNKWHNIMISYGNGEGKVYLDGKLISKKSGSYVIPTGMNLYIGAIGGKCAPNVYISNFKYYAKTIE